MSHQPHLSDAAEVRDHWWWRPGWHVGQRGYTWHLTFDGQRGLHRLARQYQAALSHLAQVDLIPLEWLHLTMQGVGFVGEVPDDDLAAIRAAVGRRLASIPPASLSFGPTVLLPEAIALPPLPAEPVHVIRGAIRAGIADVWGGSGVPEADDGYRAHVSIGYVNSPGSARPIVDALRRTNAEPASVTVWAASLIMLNRDERVYRWSTVDAVPLGGETVSPLSPESPYPG